MSDVTMCYHVPKILAPPKSYVFTNGITTIFTPIKSWLHSNLQKKSIIKFNKVEKDTRESSQNTFEVVHTNYEERFHNIDYHPQGVV
ncbi:hypothetical protein MKS88_001579 [Plasmodium brasilianum]|uniref:Uncharacterized protein n=1 Tax=Plasmodium brasilianum TaxID=5824 RepID=A0ACB9YEF5_PLABR|nr:hypothetical protein MKS88_001579 [Plasmodium brasilianum]